MTFEGVPPVGLGTFDYASPQDCIDSIATAIDLGYRHVDTAQNYDNERAVGEGIRRSPVDRADLVLATKVWVDDLGYDDVIESTRRSLDRLGVEAVDVCYVHWPGGTYSAAETLPAFDHLRDTGEIGAIGLSNFTPALIDEAREVASHPIDAVQAELHPELHQTTLLEYTAANDMWFVGHTPMMRGAVGEVPELVSVAAKHDVSPAAVSIAWILQHDHVLTIPKSSSPEHLAENFDAASLELDPDDVALIDSIDRERRFADLPYAPEW